MTDLRKFEKVKPAKQVLHPLYDNFGDAVEKMEARKYLELPRKISFSFFLDLYENIKAWIFCWKRWRILKEQSKKPVDYHESKNISDFPSDSKPRTPLLLIAGEFYEDSKAYLDQIEKLAINDDLILKTNFIPDNEVKYYFSAADLVIQPYRNATQSGVTPLAYHFEKPMIVTNVGSLPDLGAP